MKKIIAVLSVGCMLFAMALVVQASPVKNTMANSEYVSQDDKKETKTAKKDAKTEKKDCPKAESKDCAKSCSEKKAACDKKK